MKTGAVKIKIQAGPVLKALEKLTQATQGARTAVRRLHNANRRIKAKKNVRHIGNRAPQKFRKVEPQEPPKSKFFKGIIKFVGRRYPTLNQAEREKTAFAIMVRHKQNGRPTT